MRYRYVVLLFFTMLCGTLTAQKPKAVAEFEAERLPSQLLEWMNKQSSDSDKQKENSRTVKAFEASYSAMDEATQQRVTAVANYVVKAKMKANPEVCAVLRVLTSYATAPGGGQNLDGWLAAMELFKRKASKAKAMNEFVSYSDLLLSERVLYRSNSCEWRFNSRALFRLTVEGGEVLTRFDTPSDLYYSSAKDMGTLHATTGVYRYKDNDWQGHGGRIDWERTGLGAEVCYADLADYRAETKFPKFNADSVHFVNTRYFSQPLEGRLEEALTSSMEADKYSYPRFRSYQRDFVIKNILPDVDYSGSFMMNGARFVTASSKHPASLVFNRGGRRQLAVTAMKFTITAERATAENALVAFYIGDDDSISNTGITVRYNPAEKRITLVNDPKRNFYSPYIDTYHQLDIYCDAITWKTDGDIVEFSNLSSSGTLSMATFESSSYYTFRKYREIQGIDEVSPVKRVYEYAEGNNYNFAIKGFSNYIGLDMSQTLLMIHTLSKHGLVSYNEITGRVLVKDKLEDYVKAFSRAKGFDYDALTLESTTRGTNARLGLDNNELMIRGIEQFVVSDSHNVVVFPDSTKGRMVTVGRNRALHFDGRIEAGKFVFFVTDCDFSYEQYRFEMPRISKLYFAVPNFNNPDSLHPVLTPLSNLVGSLQVDRPNNHCGLVKNDGFPMFESRENSFVYYDAANIRGGQYVRDRFYYTLHPFVINSLMDFEIDSMQFNGVLTSAGIFPDITYPLTVQRDYYLGFRTETPPAGYPAYGGKGTYRKQISLDHYGLQGNGTLDYLTSSSKSKAYLFLPDSMVAVADTFFVREEQGFPDIRNGLVSQHWLPYRDSMSVAMVKKGRPFRMYHDDAKLTGRVALQPHGATGAGTAEVKEGSLRSDRFELLTMEMNAEVSDFTLYSTTFNNVAFSAQNVRSHVDYEAHRADVTAPNGPIRTQLPLVKYDAFADLFTWEMDRKELHLLNSARQTDEGMSSMDLRMRLQKRDDLPGVQFVSTDPAQKELTYNSLRSIYLYNQADLSSRGVYLLNVADAAIAPHADSLHVTKGGKMRVLNKASLICNRDSAYHYIYNADLLVSAADSYTGKGYVDYLDDQERRQRLFLSDIGVGKDGVTVGKGTISDTSKFTLNSAFGFAGKVQVEGDQPLPYFEGGVRMLQTCLPAAQTALLSYAGYTDPNELYIPVPELPVDWRGHRISAAILINKNDLKAEQAFLSSQKAADNELLSAHGVLAYLPERNQYMIASEEKVDDPDAVIAPYLALSTDECTLEGEGAVDFSLRRTQATYYTYGTVNLGIRNSSNDSFNTLFGISFPIQADVVNALANNLKDDLSLEPIGPTTNPEMRHALIDLLGVEKGTAAYVQYSSTGELEKMPEAMRSTLLFDNIKWQYFPSFGYYYDGKVGLIGVGDNQVALQVKLKAQITKRGGKQEMIFYIQATGSHWYYFKYDLSSQELTLYSSIGTWEDQIKALPLDKRRIEKEGLGAFRYFVGNNPSEANVS